LAVSGIAPGMVSKSNSSFASSSSRPHDEHGTSWTVQVAVSSGLKRSDTGRILSRCSTWRFGLAWRIYRMFTAMDTANCMVGLRMEESV
jgi:hypothetical protein